MVERAADLAGAAAVSLAAALAAAPPSAGPPPPEFTQEACLRRIHVFRAHDAPTQQAVCEHLPALCEARPRVRLIVLDSVAFHYRQGVEDYAARNRTLAYTFGLLLKLAQGSGIAVVVTNQVTTKPGAGGGGWGGGGGGGGGVSRLAPALGESFAHYSTQARAPGGGAEHAARADAPRSISAFSSTGSRACARRCFSSRRGCRRGQRSTR